MSRTAFSALLLFALAAASPALADPDSRFGRVLALPITHDDDRLSELTSVASLVSDALEGLGTATMDRAAAAEAYDAEFSQEPGSWSQHDADRLEADSADTLASIVSGQLPQAKDAAAKTQALLAGAVDAINRNRRWARQAFDACSLEARVRFDERDLNGAAAAAFRCLLWFPGFRADERVHPTTLQAIFGEQQAEIRSLERLPLKVDSAPSGCAVFLNGRQIGVTPYRDSIPMENTPRLQVECEAAPRPGRVRLVSPMRSVRGRSFAVDTALESAIRTDGKALRLSYPNPDQADQRGHATQLGFRSRTGRVLTISSPSYQRYILTLYARGGGVSVTHQGPLDPKTARALVEQLLHPPTTSTEHRHGVAQSALPGTPRSSRPGEVYAMTASLSGLALGFGSFCGGWALYASELKSGRSFRNTLVPGTLIYLDEEEQWRYDRRATYSFMATGSVMLTVGGSLAQYLSPSELPGWLTGVSLAVGGGLATGGVVAMLRGGLCPDKANFDRRACVPEMLRLDTGAALLMSALPFLAAPGVWWLRKRNLNLTPQVSAQRGAVSVQFRGNF
ncbi:MAG: hypothetical protein RL385_18 [Pseudomonadota bacterium]|jgi:hypothetical protein